MTCSREEARAWIKQNWHDLCERRELGLVLKRYYTVYNGKQPADDYVSLKRELEKLAIDN